MLSAPTSTAPAASMRSISVASRDDGARSRLIFDPARVGRPFTSNRFFTAKGTPASGPTFSPAASFASIALAAARARSAVTSVKEFSTPSCAAIRASAPSVASRAEILRSVIACAICWADIPSLFAVMAIRPRRCWPARSRPAAGIHRPALPAPVTLRDSPAPRDARLARSAAPAPWLRHRCNDPDDRRPFRSHSTFLMYRQRRMRDRRQQFLRIGVLRIAEHAFGRTLLEDAPPAHHDDTIAQQTYHIQIMRHEQIAHAHRRLEILQQVEHHRLHGDIQCRGRLVENHEFWMQRNRARDA